ncbi:MAG: Arm DNA-binding domain-containing protein, partial [bacterium]
MKIKYYLPRKNDECSNIMMNISWEGKRLQVSSGSSIETKYWDSLKNKVKNNYKHAIALNNNLELLKANIMNAHLVEKSNNKDTSKVNIKAIVKNIIKPIEPIEPIEVEDDEDNINFKDLFQMFMKKRFASKKYNYTTVQR